MPTVLLLAGVGGAYWVTRQARATHVVLGPLWSAVHDLGEVIKVMCDVHVAHGQMRKFPGAMGHGARVLPYYKTCFGEVNDAEFLAAHIADEVHAFSHTLDMPEGMRRMFRKRLHDGMTRLDTALLRVEYTTDVDVRAAAVWRARLLDHVRLLRTCAQALAQKQADCRDAEAWFHSEHGIPACAAATVVSIGVLVLGMVLRKARIVQSAVLLPLLKDSVDVSLQLDGPGKKTTHTEVVYGCGPGTWYALRALQKAGAMDANCVTVPWLVWSAELPPWLARVDVSMKGMSPRCCNATLVAAAAEDSGIALSKVFPIGAGVPMPKDAYGDGDGDGDASASLDEYTYQCALKLASSLQEDEEEGGSNHGDHEDEAEGGESKTQG